MPSAPLTSVGSTAPALTSPSLSTSAGLSRATGALVCWGRYFTEAKMGRQAFTKRRTSSSGRAGT